MVEFKIKYINLGFILCWFFDLFLGCFFFWGGLLDLFYMVENWVRFWVRYMWLIIVWNENVYINVDFFD